MRLPLPPWMLRILRLALVAVAAYLGFHLLAPHGYGWVVLVAAGALAALWIGARAFRIARDRAEDARADRWAGALMHPPSRPAVIAELEEELRGIEPARAPGDHARVALVLAELLEADGRAAEALAVLERVQTDALTPSYAAVIHHARAVAALSAGEVDAAEAALDGVGGPVGERGIDLRVRLMRGVIAVERGDAAEGLAIAEDALDEAGPDRDLATEARVLRALAHDAEGDEEAALAAMRRLGDEMLEVLTVLGLPRVRALAQAALDAD